MLHHILAKAAQKDNSGGCLSPPALFLCVPMHDCLWVMLRAEENLCTVFLIAGTGVIIPALKTRATNRVRGRGYILGETSI